MGKTETKTHPSPVLNDLKQLWYDFIRVYPRSLYWVTSHWVLSVIFLLILFSSFYLDGAVRTLVIESKSYPLDKIAGFGRWYGDGAPTLYVFLLLYIGGFVFKRFFMRNTGVLIFESYIYAGLVTLIFKSLFGRLRPFTNQGDLSFTGMTWGPNEQLSFFSGHASVAFALSTVLASTTDNIYLKGFYYSLAVITALSRIYHDQHWLSDVVMGSFEGILISSMLIQMHKEKHSK